MVELNGENYLSGDEACNLLGVKVATLYAYVSRGILRSYKQGIRRQRLYKQAELEGLLQVRPGNASSLTSFLEQAGDDAEKESNIPHAKDWMPDV